MSRQFKDAVAYAVDVIFIHHELLSVEVAWLGILFYTMEGKSPLLIVFL